MLADEGDKVEKGQPLAQWDPYTLPIITEKEGYADFVDMVEGVSMREATDEATGIVYKVVIDWKQQPRGADLRPRVSLRPKKDLQGGRSRQAREWARCALLHVGRRDPECRARPACEGGDILARIPRESSKTRDITGGLPRVAELFEARRPKDHADHRGHEWADRVRP